MNLRNELLTLLVLAGAILVNALLVREALRLNRQARAHRQDRDRAARALRLMDAENSRSAAELYDGLAQTLAGVLLRLRMLGRSSIFRDGSRDSGGAEAVHLLEEVRSEVLEALEEAREIARRLHPPELKELGLASALEALARACLERSGVNVVVRADRTLPPLPSDVELAFFRIAQESLRNVVQHADAGLATITLARADGGLTMRVCDDGRGFDTSAVLNGAPGLGLSSIQERAAQAGGRVSIRSSSSEGTCIELTVPLAREGEGGGYQHGDPPATVVRGAGV